jgi:hypothetical protein
MADQQSQYVLQKITLDKIGPPSSPIYQLFTEPNPDIYAVGNFDSQGFLTGTCQIMQLSKKDKLVGGGRVFMLEVTLDKGNPQKEFMQNLPVLSALKIPSTVVSFTYNDKGNITEVSTGNPTMYNGKEVSGPGIIAKLELSPPIPFAQADVKVGVVNPYGGHMFTSEDVKHLKELKEQISELENFNYKLYKLQEKVEKAEKAEKALKKSPEKGAKAAKAADIEGIKVRIEGYKADIEGIEASMQAIGSDEQLRADIGKILSQGETTFACSRLEKGGVNWSNMEPRIVSDRAHFEFTFDVTRGIKNAKYGHITPSVIIERGETGHEVRERQVGYDCFAICNLNLDDSMNGAIRLDVNVTPVTDPKAEPVSLTFKDDKIKTYRDRYKRSLQHNIDLYKREDRQLMKMIIEQGAIPMHVSPKASPEVLPKVLTEASPEASLEASLEASPELLFRRAMFIKLNTMNIIVRELPPFHHSQELFRPTQGSRQRSPSPSPPRLRLSQIPINGMTVTNYNDQLCKRSLFGKLSIPPPGNHDIKPSGVLVSSQFPFNSLQMFNKSWAPPAGFSHPNPESESGAGGEGAEREGEDSAREGECAEREGEGAARRGEGAEGGGTKLRKSKSKTHKYKTHKSKTRKSKTRKSKTRKSKTRKSKSRHYRLRR